MKAFLIIALLAFKLNSVAQKQYDPSVFYRDTAKYSGIIKGFTSKSTTKGTLYLNDIIKGLQIKRQFEIKNDGTFLVKILLNHPQDVIITMPGFMGSVYLEPGRALLHVIETKKTNNSSLTRSTFNGELAKVNTELAKARDLYQSFGFTKIQVDSNVLFFEELLVSQMERLKKYKDSAALSDKAFAFLAINIKMSVLLRYADYVGDTANVVTPERLQLFKECLRRSSLNESSNLLSANYRYLIGRLRYSKMLLPSTSKEQWIEIVKSFPDASKFTAKEQLDFEKIKDMVGLQKFNDSHPRYVGSIASFSTKMDRLNRITALKAILGVPDGLMYDLMRMQTFSSLMEDFFTPFSEKQLTEAKKQLSTLFLKNGLQIQNNELKASILKNKFLAKNANVLSLNTWEAILEKFKGKVIYVDFWATWCVPCREEIEEIAPLKQVLKGENIVFLYITNQTSPIESYERRIPLINGNHVRLSTAEWKRVSEKFDVLGLPHYLIIGKEGEVVENKVSFNEVSELKKKLINVLKR